jgi:hypothetical protein
MVPAQNPNLQHIGSDGAFRVGGLLRGREYVLHAWDERTMRTAFSPPVAAGTARFLFTVADVACRERVDGRTVDRYGSPLAGVLVRLTMRVHEAPGYISFHSGQEVRTGPDGAFELRQVPCQDLLLRFDGDHIVSLERELAADDPGTGLLVTMAALCRFRYEARALTATSLSVLDADEHPMRLIRQTGTGRSEGGYRFPVESGASAELQARDEAAWLVLEAGGRVLHKLPIQLQRGEVNVLRD